MYLGRYQVGVELSLQVQCTDSGGGQAAPDAAPTVTIYDSAGNRVVNAKKIPVMDRFNAAGLFGLNLFLGGLFALGRYGVVYNWTIGGFTGKDVQHFDVIPGGHKDGAVIAMYDFQRPHARFIVQQLDSGKLVVGRNPSI